MAPEPGTGLLVGRDVCQPAFRTCKLLTEELSETPVEDAQRSPIPGCSSLPTLP